MARSGFLRATGWITAALVLCAAAQSLSAVPRAALPVFQRPVMDEYAAADLSFVLAGLRRFGADMAFIQLLQYYGTPEDEADAPRRAGHKPKEEKKDEHGHVYIHMGGEGQADLHPHIRLTSYARLLDYARRTVSLDPYFHYATLFSAGALAFNLNRPDQALELLQDGMRRDPSFWRFRLYAGAIAFRQSAEIDKAVQLLEEALRYPDCPSMVANILANIHKKQGNYRRAAEIYLQIIRTSHDREYVSLAREKLEQLRRQGVID